jgi:RES domain
VWRVGHVSDPFNHVPLSHCHWAHRFDNPRLDGGPSYRTLYCAEHRETCFGEVFKKFASDVKTAFDQARSSGRPLDEFLRNEIDASALADKAIGHSRIQILEGNLVPLDDPGVRRRLEIRHWELLQKHGFNFLDISAARSNHRNITKEIGRTLFEEGAAGIIYGSNFDNRTCIALFESRAVLEPLAKPEPLVDLVDEIQAVLSKLDIVIKAV